MEALIVVSPRDREHAGDGIVAGVLRGEGRGAKMVVKTRDLVEKLSQQKRVGLNRLDYLPVDFHDITLLVGFIGQLNTCPKK